MKTTETRKTYKPIQFPWALEACETQHKMHWLPYEIDLSSDISDFTNKLNNIEKNLLVQILRFFTQVDVEVGRCYVDYYLKIFQCTEIRMMLISFASMETIHVIAYSFLITSLRLPDTEYGQFLSYKEMTDKYDYMQSFDINNPQGVALTLAIVSAFIEGLALFSSFTILMYFSTYRKSKSCLHGVGQIVSFSIRDETLHCMSIIKLFHEYCSENKEKINIEELNEKIYEACNKIIEQESHFIDLAFEMGDLEDLSKDDMKKYIHFLADLRLGQLGLKPIFGVDTNPLPWTETFLFPREIANFFENTPTGYTKGDFTHTNLNGIWEEFND